MAAAAQFVTNTADSAVEDASKSSAFHNYVWFQDQSTDYTSSNHLSWGQYNETAYVPSHAISYYAYGSYQPGYGSQLDAGFGYTNLDRAVASREVDQLAWGSFGAAGYYPTMVELRDGVDTSCGSSDWSSWACLARTIDPGYWTPGGSAMTSQWYQTADVMGQCVKQEVDDRDVIKHASRPSSVPASLIYQVASCCTGTGT